MADDIAITAGTGVTLRSDDVGGIQYPYVKIDVGANGASSAFTGTLGAVTNLAGGTVGVLTTGSVVMTNGTVASVTNVANGTVFAKTLGTEVNPGNEWTASGNLTGTATGTIKAAVSGSVIYVTTLVVNVQSTGRVSVASGTPTIPCVGGTYVLADSGGIALMPINPPARTTSGSALVFNQSGTGILSYFASGFVE